MKNHINIGDDCSDNDDDYGDDDGDSDKDGYDDDDVDGENKYYVRTFSIELYSIYVSGCRSVNVSHFVSHFGVHFHVFQVLLLIFEESY